MSFWPNDDINNFSCPNHSVFLSLRQRSCFSRDLHIFITCDLIFVTVLAGNPLLKFCTPSVIISLISNSVPCILRTPFFLLVHICWKPCLFHIIGPIPSSARLHQLLPPKTFPIVNSSCQTSSAASWFLSYTLSKPLLIKYILLTVQFSNISI